MSGVFFALVGSSGVGKDTILDSARMRLEQTGQYYFPTRLITRPADAGGEEHHSISNAEFVQSVRGDKFSLWWSAHDMQYALPDDVYEKLRLNTHVVANISRRKVSEAIKKFSRVEVIEITACHETICKRLMSRGRESEAEIMVRRLREISPDWSSGANVTVIENEASISEAVDRFIEALLRLPNQSVQQAQTA